MANILDMVFGQTPEVAPYVPTDLSVEQLKAITENISAFPEIQQLGGLYENYMLDAFKQAGLDLQPILQGGDAMVRQMETVGQQFLKGEVPQDVQDQIRRQDALTSMLSGGPGGASALTARDLGLTSLNMINQGAALAGEAGNAAQRWAGLASGLIMSPSGMMVTPQQQAQQTMMNNLYKQATRQLRYNLAAAPDPAAAGISGTLMNLLGAYLGHGMGGGGGSITPSYSSIMGGTTSGQGINFGGANPYSATTGGFNFGGSNVGGQSIQYMGGGMPSDVSTPGYYMGGQSVAPTSINEQVVLPTSYGSPIADPYGLGGYYG